MMTCLSHADNAPAYTMYKSTINNEVELTSQNLYIFVELMLHQYTPFVEHTLWCMYDRYTR